MKCPSCGSHNQDDALSCDICQTVLRKEKPAAAAASARSGRRRTCRR